jgi:excinuclease ABC subunit C
MQKENFLLSKKELKKAPQTIGVYQFLGGKKPLYIGKAVNLKARLASHRQNAKQDPREKALWKATDTVAITLVESEFKALLLEAELIRKKKPKYNRRLRDDKSALYIEITGGDYPKVLLARKTDLSLSTKEKSQFFGPFQSKGVVQQVTREIRKVIPFCTRTRLSKSPCFHSKIGLCDPCPNAIENEKKKSALKRRYRRNIRQVTKILKGEIEPVTKALKKEIKGLSDGQKYEEALIARNHLMRFERLITQQLGIGREVVPNNQKEALQDLKKLLKESFPSLKNLRRIEAYDVSSTSQKQATASMVVFTEGRVDRSQYRKFKIKTPGIIGDTPMLVEILERRLKNRWPKPNLIVVDGGRPQVKALLKTLQELKEDIPVVGIAKAPDRLVLGIKNLPTKRPPLDHAGFNLLRHLRDESHRFSRKYHLLLRGKTLLPQS